MLTTPLVPSTESGSSARTVAIGVRGVSYAYGSRQALDNVSLDIDSGRIFAILGPNGGGKSTLFRLISTLMPLQAGSVNIFGYELPSQADAVRQLIGVVFQSPSLDRKLTTLENICLQGSLYGLSKRDTARRADDLLERFAIADRANDLVERLSGGLRRRVELAKCLIHQPRLLLLDEPTTGLDPVARAEVWRYLRDCRDTFGTTIVFTTHFLDEADAADRIAIFSLGQIVALGDPAELRAEIGGDSITLETDDAPALAAAIQDRMHYAARVIDGAVRLETPEGHRQVAQLVESFPGRITAIRLGKPTLEDVFIARTGHRFASERAEDSP